MPRVAATAPQRSTHQVWLLSVLFGISTVSGTIVVAAASVVGAQLSGRPELATLPVALALLGGLSATVPASQAMARWGRRAGFALGTGIALVGALVAAWGIHESSFLVFCAGSFILGILGGVSPYYRFTAVEVAPQGRAHRAIGYVLAGGVAAGLLGPPLGAAARDLWGTVPFAGSYAVMAALSLVVLLLLPFLRVPPPSHATTPSSPAAARKLSHIARDPRARAATLAAVTAYAAMVTTMVAAPVSMHQLGFHFGDTALVIQAHVVAMFAPSFFTGSLVARIGSPRTMALGLAALALCVAINLSGHGLAHHWAALVLLGVGWNLLFVAATALLTQTHTASEKGRVQGANDFLVAAVGAASALAAGPLQAALGWWGLNVAVGVFLLLTGIALALLLARPGRQEGSPLQPAPGDPAAANPAAASDAPAP